MKEDAILKKQIVDIVMKFEEDQMWITPALISVALEPRLIIVTLQGITSRAEKHYAESDNGRSLLMQLYDRLFESVKQLLERAIAQTMGTDVERASLSVDPNTGRGVMMFSLTDKVHCR